LQVLKPPCEFPAAIDPQCVAETIQRHLTLFDLAGEDKEFALAFQWRGEPSYERIVAFARGIVAGLARSIALKQPLYLILDGDLAQTLGGVLRDDLGVESEVLVIDGIVLVDFDYIDLGRIRLPSHTVPVTVKSLVFKDNPQGQAPPHHHLGSHAHHHHGRESPQFRLRSGK
jgi:ethanolamine utilization protein EutA